ncbi:hypothetical protein AUJ14_02860 [Candidatus Micrarchaeota archaeon CG1_02_55_22]|nr:MAG: hypothetical protein AUJ14_02860 [Candidatus Micrarchaeota archaeon CG1_02_55_22]
MKIREFVHRLFGVILVPLAVFGPFSFIRVWANKARGVRIGRGVWIGYLAFIDQPPEIKETMVEIGEGTGIGFRNSIFSHDSSPEWHGSECDFRKVVIGKNVYLGANVTIMPGVTIGDGAVIGACALVNKDIPANTVAVGVPARPIKKIVRKSDGSVEYVALK